MLIQLRDIEGTPGAIASWWRGDIRIVDDFVLEGHTDDGAVRCEGHLIYPYGEEERLRSRACSNAGAVATWSDNYDAPPPYTVRLASAAAELAIANGHACARLQDQRIQCWGSAGGGVLGYGDVCDLEYGDEKPIVDLPGIE